MKNLFVLLMALSFIFFTQNVTEASNQPTRFGKWFYGVSENEFDGSKAYEIATLGTTKMKDVKVSITGACDKESIGFIIQTAGIQLGQWEEGNMRIKIDNKEPETYSVGQQSHGEFQNIFILYAIDGDNLLKEMASASETIKFEIFDYRNTQIVVTAQLEGFKEAYEKMKPHCISFDF